MTYIAGCPGGGITRNRPSADLIFWAMVEMRLDGEKVWYKEERAARLRRDSLNRSEAESELFKADHRGMLGQQAALKRLPSSSLRAAY